MAQNLNKLLTSFVTNFELTLHKLQLTLAPALVLLRQSLMAILNPFSKTILLWACVISSVSFTGWYWANSARPSSLQSASCSKKQCYTIISWIRGDLEEVFFCFILVYRQLKQSCSKNRCKFFPGSQRLHSFRGNRTLVCLTNYR